MVVRVASAAGVFTGYVGFFLVWDKGPVKWPAHHLLRCLRHTSAHVCRVISRRGTAHRRLARWAAAYECRHAKMPPDAPRRKGNLLFFRCAAGSQNTRASPSGHAKPRRGSRVRAALCRRNFSSLAIGGTCWAHAASAGTPPDPTAPRSRIPPGAKDAHRLRCSGLPWPAGCGGGAGGTAACGAYGILTLVNLLPKYSSMAASMPPTGDAQPAARSAVPVPR